MEEINLRDTLIIIWNKKIRIFLITAIFIALGTFYSYKYIIPEYTSSATLVLATSEGKADNKTNTITTTDITLNSKLVSTYSELLKSKNVLRQVISNLRLNVEEDELRENIAVTSVKETELIKISVTSKNPTDASKIANEMANVFIEEVSEIYNINNVHIVDKAEINVEPSNINHIKDIIIFGLIGVFISVTSAFISDKLDTTVKTSEEVEKQFKVPVLASTPLYEFSDGKKKNKHTKIKKELVSQRDPKSPISEIFRALRTNIQFMNASKKLETILITSTFPGEGKSWISSNLAVIFAQTGKKVILIDADMRKGRIYTIFGISPIPGLSNYLTEINTKEREKIDITKYIQETEVKNLSVLTGGNVPPNPSELLVSSQMTILLNNLKKDFDIIIIDGTPTELVTDSVILSRVVDSTIVVTAYKETKKDSLERTIKSIKNVGGNTAGIVINKMPALTKNQNERYYYDDLLRNKEEEIIDNSTHTSISQNREEIKNDDTNESSEEKNKEELAKTLNDKTNDIIKQVNLYIEEEKKNLNQKEEN